jgi:DeoR/GlpR family transcriptional regulator of sugar metabolism
MARLLRVRAGRRYLPALPASAASEQVRTAAWSSLFGAAAVRYGDAKEADVLAQERRDAILRALLPSGAATVADLADGLGVSEMTIRRDLGVLAAQQLVEKVHGGAVLAKRGAAEPHFAAKRHVNAAAKAAIAEAAAPMVTDGMTVALSAGTTTWQVARRLRGGAVRDLTFVTNSLNVAGALEANGWHSIVVSGGSFRTPSDALVGPFANQVLRQLNTDLLLLGVHSIDPRVGLTTPNIAEAETNRVMVAGARRVVVVADSSKLGQVSLATFAACDEIDELVTDTGADQATLDALADTGLRIRLVEPRPLARPANGAAS